jgi:hypothetical protein
LLSDPAVHETVFQFRVTAFAVATRKGAIKAERKRRLNNDIQESQSP